MDLLLGTLNPEYENKKSQNQFLLDSDGDLQFNELGLLRTVENKDKLTQQVGKILLTEQGTNIFEERYGTILNSFIGVPVVDDTTYAVIKQTILDALGLFIGVQQDIDNPEEKLATVETLSVLFNQENKNEVQIELIITNEAIQEVLVTLVLPLG